MYRINNLHIIELGYLTDRGANALKSFSEALAAMGRYQQQFLCGIEKLPVLRRKSSIRKTVTHIQHRIDTGVACYVSDIGTDVIIAQILRSSGRRGNMNRRDPSHQHAIHLFRKRLAHVTGPQSCLDVADRNICVKACERSTERSGCVTLHEDNVGGSILDYRLKLGQNTAGRLHQSLPRRHHVQVIIRLDLKNVKDLIEHLSVLCSDTHLNLQLFGSLTEVVDNWTQLDRFRPGAKNKQDFRRGHLNPHSRHILSGPVTDIRLK